MSLLRLHKGAIENCPLDKNRKVWYNIRYIQRHIHMIL